jgi:hypothetical protein
MSSCIDEADREVAYIKFNAKVLPKIFYFLIKPSTYFGLSCWPSTGSFLICAAFASSYMVEILHI